VASADVDATHPEDAPLDPDPLGVRAVLEGGYPGAEGEGWEGTLRIPERTTGRSPSGERSRSGRHPRGGAPLTCGSAPRVWSAAPTGSQSAASLSHRPGATTTHLLPIDDRRGDVPR
jgi:hypothetical protein